MNFKFAAFCRVSQKSILFFTLCAAFSAQAQDVSRQAQSPGKMLETQRLAQWKAVKPGLSFGFGSSNVRYEQDQVPMQSILKKDTLHAWKGEKVHSQLLVWGNEPAKIEVVAGSLQLKNASPIPVKSGFVGYVWTDEFGNGCGHRKSVDFDSSLVADIIQTGILKADLAAASVQPVWLSVEVPANAPAGLYEATISLKTGKQNETATLYVQVGNRTLPEPKDWSFSLDLWQHPAAVARVHHVELWSDAHFEKMRPYYTMLARAGQKNITTSIVHEPWNHQTYDDYPSLVQWTKRTDGSWAYDYSLFDRYVQFVMDCGIDARINCYSMIPWKIAFQYWDEASGKHQVFTHNAGTPEYHRFWKTMLVDFTRHLKEKGWFEKTVIAMDERPMKAMQAVIEVLNDVDTAWKIALAGDYHPEIQDDIYEYCVASRWKFPADVLAQRKDKGYLSTWYTCCTEVYPNGFTFSPPAEHVWIGWYTAAHQMDGYLRWAYNSWTQQPNHDSRFKTWPAGDTYQVYVGPYTSIRFEKLIEGIQDYEKIRILRNEFSKTDGDPRLEKLSALLRGFEIGRLKEVTAKDMVGNAKMLLAQW